MNREKFTPSMIEVARQGGNVLSIVREIERIEKPRNMVVVMILFKAAFDLNISDVLKIDSWYYFHKSGIGVTDEERDQILMPLIRKNLGMEDWPETS